MTIRVRLFASLRDRAGTAEVVLDVAPETTAGGAAEEIFVRYPDLRDAARGAAYAVNLNYAARETVLNDGDELALLPPVSGG